MFQTQVNRFLARGIEGEYADDSPRREQGYILLANTIDGAAATGALAFTANPADGDTVTIGSVVYRFKDTLAQANDIKIGTAVTNTLASLEKTINGDGEEGTDYFAGTTTPLSIVTASVSSQTLNLTATEAGIAGNSIALASSDENVTPTAFSGGADEVSYLPQFACAFTHAAENGQAVLGGEGVFAGVLVNPKIIFVKSQSAYAIGNIAAYDKTTGAINAYVNTEAVPENAVVIPNARFIKYAGDAGTVGVLELGD